MPQPPITSSSTFLPYVNAFTENVYLNYYINTKFEKDKLIFSSFSLNTHTSDWQRVPQIAW